MKIILLISAFFLTGCAAIKPAPDSVQKLNAYLLNKTAAQAASTAKQQQAGEQLEHLTALAAMQSQAITQYYGKPENLPDDFDIENLDYIQKAQLAELAFESASAGDRYRDAAFDLLDISIAVCGLFGGAFGIKAAGFLSKAKSKARALEEIIKGNESFKTENPEYCKIFKNCHKSQSAETKEIVTQLKNKKIDTA